VATETPLAAAQQRAREASGNPYLSLDIEYALLNTEKAMEQVERFSHRRLVDFQSSKPMVKAQ
jgi:hypothetical protein